MTKIELEKEIVRLQKSYYNGTPEVSDEEFDILWDTLKSNYPDSFLLEQVGKDEIDADKYPHEISMGSQSKIRTRKELEDWIRLKNIHGDILIQAKLDGISVELIYENGKMIKALSRGDGKIGSDLTKNIINVPEVSEKRRFSARGEIVLFESKFKEMNMPEGVYNLRNMASGIAYQRNTTDNIDKINVLCYDINLPELKTEEQKINALIEFGFDTPPYNLVNSSKIEEIMGLIDWWEKAKENLPYEIDGVVLKQNIIPDVIEDRARPNHQRAFKWQSEQVITTIIGVDWSRNGNNYTPVAILKPVEVSGTMVSRASLANMGEIKRLDLKIPSEVVIEKRGEIIPKIMEVFNEGDNAKEIEPPEVCAFCGEGLVATDSRIYCANKECPTILEHRLSKWLEMTGAMGFGPAIIDYLYYTVGINHIHQLYCENELKLALSATNKKKVIQKAFAELWARNKIKLEDFVSGFDIPTIGSKVVKLMVDAGYDTLEKLRKVNYNSLIEIDGIGPERAKIFIEYMVELQDTMDAVLNTNRIVLLEGSKKVSEENSSLSGKTFCITGKLSIPRQEIERIVIDAGGKVASSITSNVNYLLTNDTTSGSSKNIKAKELNIPIISEEEFWKLIK
jgi:DNA ligase (NAD+)